MGLTALVCPQCGAKITLDDDREFGFCSFCGTKIMIERSDRVTHIIDHSGEAKNYLLRAKDFFENYDYDNAEIYANKVLDIDFSCEEAKELLKNARRANRGNNFTIVRKKAFAGAAASIHVFVNDKEVAKLKEGQQISYRLPDGQYELYTKATFNKQSEKVTISVDRYCNFAFETYIGLKTVLKEVK